MPFLKSVLICRVEKMCVDLYHTSKLLFRCAPNWDEAVNGNDTHACVTATSRKKFFDLIIKMGKMRKLYLAK